MRVKKTRRATPVVDGFLLTPDPRQVLSVLNDEGAAEWARGMEGIWLDRCRREQGILPSAVDAETIRIEYARQGQRLKVELTELADEWLQSGKDWGSAGAQRVRKLVEEFLKKRPPKVDNFCGLFGGLPVLVFPGQNKTAEADANHRLRLLLLYIVASDWSRDFYRCTCGRFFVRKRTSAEEPKCSRKCNEGPRKQAQRKRNKQQQKREARKALKKLRELEPDARPRDLWEWVAQEASLHLPEQLAFKKTFVTQNFEAQILNIKDQFERGK